MSYREIGLLIALGVPVFGVLIEFARLQLLLGGFGSLRKELNAIVNGVTGQFERDADDLILRGRYGQWPVLIRFSQSAPESGMSINVPVPSNLTLFCYPNAHVGEEGHVPLQISDARLMSRFRLTTNSSPLEVNAILASPAVQAELSKIMDPQNHLALKNRNLEVAEAVIVPEHLAARTLNCVRGMTRIAAEATGVQAGSGVVPASPKRRTNWFRIGYVAASAMILATIGVADVVAHRPAPVKAQTPAAVAIPEIPGNLAKQIPELQGWHIATSADFDSSAVAWLAQQGEQPSGQIEINLNDESQAVVYVLKRPQGAQGRNVNRVVLFMGDQKRFDAELPEIDVVGRISKDRISAIEWRDRITNVAPSGDGLILVQRYRDPGSALVFFATGSRLLTAVPKDFRPINLQ